MVSRKVMVLMVSLPFIPFRFKLCFRISSFNLIKLLFELKTGTLVALQRLIDNILAQLELG